MSDVDTSSAIRIAAGHVSKSTILGSSSYLLENLPIQTDSIHPHWQGYVEGNFRDGSIVTALSGSGGLYGLMSGTLILSVMTPDMQDYWFTTIMQSKYRAPVTLYFYHHRYKFIAVNCYMQWYESPGDIGTLQTNKDYSSFQLTWDRGTIIGNAYSTAYSEAYS